METSQSLNVEVIDNSEQYRRDYRNAMARLGAGTNIVTTDGSAGRAGFAATAVCSVTDTPPTLLVCLNRGSSAYAAVHGNRTLCVNVLGGEHAELCRIFGGGTPVDQRFDTVAWAASETGCPRLPDALVSFDCRISSMTACGTHDIALCEVQAITIGEAKSALIYFERRYHAICREGEL
ncbi:flavin reductase [Paraburkholderia caffeinilytica]|uniref:flavin reductase n=1 Tax=Paraburkholderia caffeinilytica TaxID=1761016 RepID=UPI0038BAF7BA